MRVSRGSWLSLLVGLAFLACRSSPEVERPIADSVRAQPDRAPAPRAATRTETMAWKIFKDGAVIDSGQQSFVSGRDTTVLPAPLPIPTPEPTPTPPSGWASTCLPGTGTLKVLAGPQPKFDSRTSPIAAKGRLNAWAATWTGSTPYLINNAGGDGSCWSGGRAIGTWNEATTVWDIYHSTFAMFVYGANRSVEGFYAKNYGDCIRFNGATTGKWSFRSSRCVNIHDDVVENDMLKPGSIDDVLADGAYVGWSIRPGASQLASVDGHNDTMAVTNTLLRLAKFANTAEAPNTTGGFIKAENREPAKNIRLILMYNVWRADTIPGTGDLRLNPHGIVVRSVGNTMVWLGRGACPCLPLPVGWTLTTDSTVWVAAVNLWKMRHPEPSLRLPLRLRGTPPEPAGLPALPPEVTQPEERDGPADRQYWPQ